MEKLRLISVFDKKDKFVREIELDSMALNDLVQIFNPSADDPEMIYVYKIGKEEAQKLSELLDIDFDFSRYIYQLDCYEQ